MKAYVALAVLLVSFTAHSTEDLWTWMIAGKERLIVKCHSRGVVEIDSFDSELVAVRRTTGEKGCKTFDVMHVRDIEGESWLNNININATVYGLDRLKRSPSELVDWRFGDAIIYPLKLLAIRIQTKRLGRLLTKFLEMGEYPKAERVSDDYLRLFVEQAQIAHDDFLTLSK